MFSRMGRSGKPPSTDFRPVPPPQVPVMVTSSPRWVVGFGLTCTVARAPFGGCGAFDAFMTVPSVVPGSADAPPAIPMLVAVISPAARARPSRVRWDFVVPRMVISSLDPVSTGSTP